MLVNAAAIRVCSGRGGKTIDIFERTFPLVKALVVYVQEFITRILKYFVEKQYLQYKSNNESLNLLALKIKPLNTQFVTLSIIILERPTSSGVSEVLVKNISPFFTLNRAISLLETLTIPFISDLYKHLFL